MKIVDVSLPLSPGLHTWPDNPSFELEPVKRMATGASSNVSRLVLGSHSGTHVDAPRHFFDGGKGVDELSLAALIGPCRVVELDVPPGRHPLTKDAIERGAGSPAPERLLLKTPNSRLWGTPAFTPDFAYVDPAAAEWMVSAGVRVVGTDYLSIEEFRRAGAPTHRALLAAGIVIIEGLNLADVTPGAYELICLPLRIAGADGSPARVILRQEEPEKGKT